MTMEFVVQTGLQFGGVAVAVIAVYIKLVRQVDKLNYSIEMITREHKLLMDSHTNSISLINLELKELNHKHDVLMRDVEYIKGKLRKND